MTLLLSVLAASLLGSVHCAAMCGGFVCLYAGTGGATRDGGSRSALPDVAYNTGRLVSYVVLGALAGALGRGLDRVGAVAGLGRLAAIVAGVLMVVWGGSTLLAALGVAIPVRVAPRRLQAILTSALVRFRHQGATIRGAVTGLLTTLIPCGWLYMFVATAGGTGRVVDGMLVMAVFWLGTLPMMVTIGLGVQRAFGGFARRLPLVAAGVAVLMGALSMTGRLTASPLAHGGHAMEMPHGDR